MSSFSIRPLAHAVAFVLSAGCLHGQLAIDDSVRTFTTLTNTTVTLTGKSELHITGTSNPVSGSTIHLNSHDSWLFFDKIRPNTVNSSYIGQVRVNGAPAAHGTNVRVVQYGMGTVITPFTNSEQPLETFTDPGFLGGSKKYNLYTYYDSSGDLGVMHRNISSFKLKRGFMASFGTQTNGTGVTKLYIAQDHDVNIAAMPGNLDNEIQFVRVFPWRWVSKKGSCDVSADVLNAAWYYNWNNNTDSTLNWEYVPIRQQRWWPGYPTNKPNVTHLSGFNEPDNPIEDSYQSLNNGSRDAALAAWPELLATGLRVGSPVTTDAGKWWLYDFMDKANAAGRRVDYIALHFYRCGQSSAQLKAWMQEVWDRYHKPIWLTEFNNGADWTTCGDPTTSQNASVIGSWIDMMDSTPWIERYSVYSNVEWQRNMTWNASWSGGSGLTPAGEVYRDQQSPIGYLQETYPLAVRRGIARLPMEGNTRDSSGFDNGAVSYGAPVFTTGQNGQAIEFDGSSRYLRLPPGVSNSGSFTFAAWVRWDGGDANQRIFDFGNDTDQYLFLSPDFGGSMRFGLRNNNGTTNSISTAVLPTGSWQHVAVTMQGSNAKIYLNGNLQIQGTVAGSALSGTSRNYIGKSQWSTDPLFDGAIDDVYLLDSAVDETMIAELMTGVSSPFTAHWAGDVDGQWNTDNAGDTNWAVDAANTADTAQKPGGFTEVNFSNGPATTVLGDDFSIDSLVVTTPSPVTIGGTHDLTIGANGIYAGNAAGPANIDTSGSVIVATDQTWTNHSANDFMVASELSGTANLTVSGAGSFALGGTNTWSGDLSIMGGGSVSVASLDDALGSASVVGLGGGGSTGALIYTGTGETSDRVLTFQGGYGDPGIVLDQSGGGLWKLTADLASIAFVSKTLTLQGSTGGEGELAGVVSNSGSTTTVVKTGSGTWTLSGTNTHTGKTYLYEGSLAIGNDNAFGSGTLDLWGGTIQSSDTTARTIANAVTVSADTTFGGTADLLFTGAVAAGTLPKTFIVENARTEFSGVISGSGPRKKAGSGTLVLSGSNTYTGPTTVSAGTLRVDGSLSAASAVTVESAGTVTGTGTIHGPVSFASGAALGWSLAENNETAGKLSSGNVTVSSGAVIDLVFDAPGSTVDFSAPFWTSIHTWPVLTSGGMSGLFTLGSVGNDPAGRVLADYGTFYLQQSPQGVSVFFAPLGLVPPDPPSGFTATASDRGVSLAWNESEGAASYLVLRSVAPGGPYETIATVVSGTSYLDEDAWNGTTYYYAVAASNPNGISDPSVETMATPHGPATIDKADNSLDLSDAGSWTGGIQPTGLDTARWTGLPGPCSVLLGSDAAWHRLVIGDTGGVVTIDGPGTLSLGSGGIGMDAATQDLTIGSDLKLTAGHQIWDVAAARSVALGTGAFSRDTGAAWNIRGGGTVSASMSGLANDGSDDSTLGGGLLGSWASVGSGSQTSYATLNGGNIIAFAGAESVPAFGWTSGNPASRNYEVAAVQGALGFNRAAHTVRYTGAAGTQTWGNSSASVTITLDGILNAGSGTLTFAKGGSGSGTGLVIGADRELVLHAANSGITINSPIFDNPGGASSLTVAGNAGVTLGGANSYTGATTVGSGSLVVSGSGTLGPGAVFVASGAELHFNKSLTVSQTVTGRGTITGTATTTLTGDFGGFAGSYVHDTTTNSTVVSNTSSLSRRAAYHIASAQGSQQGLITNVTSGSPVFELGALSGVTNSLLRNGGSVTGDTTLRIGYLHTDTTFAGTIGGGGGTLALTKVGNGTLTLSGPCAYTGATRVESGNLRVLGSLAGGSAVDVLPGATFSGTGSADGVVTIDAGGVLAPGDGAGGTLTLSGILNLADGAVLEMGIGTTSSALALGGAPVSSGITTLNLTALDGFATGSYPLLSGAGAISPAEFEIGDAPAGYQYLLSANAGTLTLTIATPPSAPANLAATPGPWTIALAWDASPGTSHYQVKRTAEGAATEVIATVFGTQYTDDTANDGVLYTYTITAWNAAGESAPSNGEVAGLLTHAAAWRQWHFGTSENSGDAADTADFDKDGLTNLLEYALGTDPKLGNAAAAPQIVPANDRLTISFTRNAHALDVVMRVWGTDDLSSGNWQELARGTGGSIFSNVVDDVATDAPVSETGSGTVRDVEVGDIYLMTDPAHPKRFLRVTAER